MLDLFSVSVMTALAVSVCGIVFITETLIRRDDGAGRIWSIAYLFGMLTTVAYGVWASGDGGVISVAIGNGFFVASAGFIWLGVRRFNQRSLLTGSLIAIAGMLLSAVMVFVLWDADGDWAGVGFMYIAVAVLTAAGAVECFRAPAGRIRMAWTLAFVLAFTSLFYVARAVVYLGWGPESALFTTLFSSIVANMVTVTFTIVGVVVTSVLRAANVEPRAFAWVGSRRVASDGILLNDVFTASLSDVAERAAWRDELVAVVSVRIDDLGQIATAFGSDVVDAITVAWRSAVRRYAPSDALVGEDGSRGIFVSFLPSSAAEARRHAAAIYRGLFDELDALDTGVIPVVGVGIALSETHGHETDVLTANAQRAARKAATSSDSSVLFSGVDTGASTTV
jgi:GGDEF domain-containing protein